MKQYLVLFVTFISLQTMAQQAMVKEAWLEKWENSKNYLIGIAEAMPEDKLDFKPTERQMSFKEQLMHIKGNMDWLSTTYFTEDNFDRTKTTTPTTKAEAISLITAAFNNVKTIIENTPEATFTETVDFFSGPKSKLQILNLLQDHVSHHRGQLVVYLNLCDVEPPRFVGW